jgi:hypothetical protein
MRVLIMKKKAFVKNKDSTPKRSDPRADTRRDCSLQIAGGMMASQKGNVEIQKAEISVSRIEQKIYLIRGQRVMLDADLAGLYGVKTKILNKAVKRNLDRFPEDFMFQLNNQELERLRFQNGTSKTGRGGSRYLPYAFTEQGVAMLSGVLTSSRAIKVNVEIMHPN